MTECARNGCSNRAWKCPVLSFAAESQPDGPRAEFLVPLACCDEHARESAAEDFMSDEGWGQLCDGFARLGRARPGRATLAIARWQTLT